MVRQSVPHVPPELTAALARDPAARAAFQSLPPSHRAEYAKFVAQAKKPRTRQSRAAKSLAMIGKWAQKRSQG